MTGLFAIRNTKTEVRVALWGLFAMFRLLLNFVGLDGQVGRLKPRSLNLQSTGTSAAIVIRSGQLFGYLNLKEPKQINLINGTVGMSGVGNVISNPS